jgi:arsenate reductase (glutaredoxin)
MELLGLAGCDTCRNARKTLDGAGLDPVFRDVRAEPLPEREVQDLFATFGEALVNRRSTTWRGLSDEERAEDAMTLLLRHPALMKRPVIRAEDGKTYLGWTDEVRTALGV